MSTTWLWRHWHRRPPRPHYLLLVIDNFAVLLHPNEENLAMTQVTVGHQLALSILFLDQRGNPMLTAPTPDAAPSWSNSTPATETLAAAADGLSAVATTVAPGTDTVSLSVVVGGVTFSATLGVEVDAEPQVLTSVGIQAEVQ